MNRILIANRGEIALRVCLACRNLGIESVAVYTEADAFSKHVTFADQSVRIGPSVATSSYLNQQALVHAAEKLKCDAIHPGYGFLSENSHFAELCESHKIQFIGPDSKTIREMGDKSNARKQAMNSGVPVVPGSGDAFADADPAENEAQSIGYPVLIKASAGGGGRGMRVVSTQSDFRPMFAQASKEAESAFGSGLMYVEKFLPNVSHVEVQILGDNFGNVQALGERDCTVQRRHQKLVEEAPCSKIDDTIRQQLLEHSERLGKSIGYKGAGTVEYILDEHCEKFYFIEMNTRIQVEHPVTEMLFRTDLIEAQLRLAMGEPLAKIVDSRPPVGHAMEFRINAENWTDDFRPSPGVIQRWNPPSGSGIRLDTHVYEGFRISPYYDSMIAKLIIYGHNRGQTLERAKNALNQFDVEGVDTTIRFHQSLLDQPDFITGNISTNWVENEFMGK